jgi:tRNA pseudouridine38/39 synthase
MTYRYLPHLPTFFRQIMTTSSRSADYSGWSREQLIERLLALECPKSANGSILPSGAASIAPAPHTVQIGSQNETTIPPKSGLIRPPSARKFNFSKHPKRKIALKFCYSGWEYCGLAYQTGATQLPTVEAVLLEALSKARLIDHEKGMEGCGWEKCGRTDRGVSAAGQVISLWLRSAVGNVEKGKGKQKEVGPVMSVQEDCTNQHQDSGLPGLTEEDFGTLDVSEPSSPVTATEVLEDSSSKPRHELDYIGILNRLLPPTIRILAWAPVVETFSARFSCKCRHYKYFFSSHLLDIAAMRQAAARLIGEHDFRNLCKVDAQKQITMFRRVISRADIEPVELNNDNGEGIFVFNLVGSAFLYHQVRHIMAILFLVGTGLEEPSLMTKLMNVSDGAENYDLATCETRLEVVNRKPEYQMADALPLMLWDCAYAEEDVIWRTGTLEFSDQDQDHDTDDDSRRTGLGTETDLYHQLHSIWNRSRVYSVLDQHFLRAAEAHHKPPISPLPLASGTTLNHNMSLNYPLGGGTYKRVQKYVPLLARNRLDPVEVINERWRNGKGSRKAERRAASGEAGEDGGDE